MNNEIVMLNATKALILSMQWLDEYQRLARIGKDEEAQKAYNIAKSWGDYSYAKRQQWRYRRLWKGNKSKPLTADQMFVVQVVDQVMEALYS